MDSRITSQQPWRIGEQLDLAYSYLRNLQYTNDNNARTKIADTYNTTQYNNGDQYVKGGVFSHWFYLLVNGGTGTNGVGNPYTVHGIGMDTAEDLIVDAVFNNFLNNSDSYTALRNNIVSSASSLYNGQNALLVNQVENAWYAVNVGSQPSQMTISGVTLLCTSSNYSVSNVPAGSSVTWSKSSNISLPQDVTTNPITATANGNGPGWLKATISLDGTSVDIVYNIWVGTPVLSISGPDEGCPNVEYYFQAVPTGAYSNSTNYSWDMYPYDGYIYPYYNNYAAITFYSP